MHRGSGIYDFWYRSIDLGTLILMVPLKAHNSAFWGVLGPKIRKKNQKTQKKFDFSKLRTCFGSRKLGTQFFYSKSISISSKIASIAGEK